MSDVGQIYDYRFEEANHAAKEGIWRVLGPFLQRYLGEGPVLDLACDRGYFIRNVSASERWATDLRDVSAHLPEDVRFVQGDSLDLTSALPASHFGTVFVSNFLEHLPGPDAVLEQLRVAFALVRPRGRLVVLQPNARLTGGAYWDFLDHRVALTDKSLVEAAELAGFATVEVITRFLPFTTKSRLPQHPAAVRAYLSFRPAWLLLGKQTLYVGEKPA
jgi:2-polyprenyl-3-methyl-5-hydroxy-6-metoxy-1,4-benzoquinol methylase